MATPSVPHYVSWEFSFPLENADEFEGLASDETTLYLLKGSELLGLRNENGQTIWHVQLPKHRDVYKPPIPDSVSVRDGRVIFCTEASCVAAVEAGTGQMIWKRDLALPDANFTFSWSPLVAEGRVFVSVMFGAARPPREGYFNSLACLDARTGEIIWRSEQVPDIVNCDYCYPLPIRPAVLGSSVFFPTATGILYAFQVESGKPLWQFTAKRSDDHQDYSLGSPVCDPDSVFIMGCEPILYALEPRTGQVRWQTEVSGGEKGWPMAGTLARSNGDLVARRPQGRLVCVEGAAGGTRWISTDQHLTHYAPVHRGGAIFVPYSKGFAGGIAVLKGATGHETNRFDLLMRIWGLKAGGQHLYALHDHGLSQLTIPGWADPGLSGSGQRLVPPGGKSL